MRLLLRCLGLVQKLRRRFLSSKGRNNVSATDHVAIRVRLQSGAFMMMEGSIGKICRRVGAGGRTALHKWLGWHGRSLCENQWQSLNHVQPQRSWLTLRFPRGVSLEAFRKSKYRFINLKELLSDDQERLSRMRIDVPCLFKNLDLEYGVERCGKKRAWQDKKDPIEDVKYRTIFQQLACCKQKLTLTCPFSGREISTDCSFVLPRGHGFVFYRFCSTEVFYLITGYPWSGFSKIGFYFPSAEIIIGREQTLGEGKGAAAVNLLKGLMVANALSVRAYIQKKKSVAVWIGHNNFAHHLWNDLPAVETALEKGLLDRISYLLVTHDTLGPLKSIFPEIPERKVRKVKSEDLFRAVLIEQLFVVRIGSNFITQSVADRVLKLAKETSSPAILERVAQARRDHYPLLWVSVRVKNRTWIRQEEGLARIISELFVDYPTLGVIFDGFSVGYGMDVSAETKKMITELHRMVEKIRQCIPQEVAVYDTIGYGIHESIVWADSIDVYLCHHGTLHHKVGWIANKPGVVHTNHATRVSDFQVNKATFSGENSLQPVYIDASHLTDIEIDYKDLSENLKNYDCDWQVMLRELRVLLSNPLIQ